MSSKYKPCTYEEAVKVLEEAENVPEEDWYRVEFSIFVQKDRGCMRLNPISFSGEYIVEMVEEYLPLYYSSIFHRTCNIQKIKEEFACNCQAIEGLKFFIKPLSLGKKFKGNLNFEEFTIGRFTNIKPAKKYYILGEDYSKKKDHPD